MNRRLANAAKLLPAVGALVAGTALASPAHSAANPYERGPAPTEAGIVAERGPFETARIEVPQGSGEGFNKGTIYYPTDRSQGTFGAVAVSPGFISPKAVIDWYGPRLASQGFVVMTFETLGLTDVPDQRADQLLAALDYLVGHSEVKDRIDGSRLAVMGHSMGGGASLRAAEKRPSLQAAIPLAPWHTDKDWKSVRVPTLILSADNDFIAANSGHSEAFYASLTNTPDKAYLELNNAGHVTFGVPDKRTAKYSIAWLKRFVDDDTRYDRFLCPGPSAGSEFDEYRSTCPF